MTRRRSDSGSDPSDLTSTRRGRVRSLTEFVDSSCGLVLVRIHHMDLFTDQGEHHQTSDMNIWRSRSTCWPKFFFFSSRIWARD